MVKVEILKFTPNKNESNCEVELRTTNSRGFYMQMLMLSSSNVPKKIIKEGVGAFMNSVDKEKFQKDLKRNEENDANNYLIPMKGFLTINLPDILEFICSPYQMKKHKRTSRVNAIETELGIKWTTDKIFKKVIHDSKDNVLFVVKNFKNAKPEACSGEIQIKHHDNPLLPPSSARLLWETPFDYNKKNLSFK